MLLNILIKIAIIVLLRGLFKAGMEQFNAKRHSQAGIFQKSILTASTITMIAVVFSV